MTSLFPILGGLGLALFVAGLPGWRRLPSLQERVLPYVAGIDAFGDRRDHPHPLRSLIERALSKLSISTDEELSARLASAGHNGAVVAFRIEQLAWGVIGLAVGLGSAVVAHAAGLSLALWSVPALCCITATTGVLARDWWLSKQVAARRDRIEEEVPVALDLVTLSVMAGEPVAAALARIGLLLPGPFGQELRRMAGQMRAGAGTARALEDLRDRCDVALVDRFVHVLLLSMERGSPLAEVLRAQVEDARDARRRWLLELAGKREVLMLVPVVFILLPTVVVFALYPALVSLEFVVP